MSKLYDLAVDLFGADYKNNIKFHRVYQCTRITGFDYSSHSYDMKTSIYDPDKARMEAAIICRHLLDSSDKYRVKDQTVYCVAEYRLETLDQRAAIMIICSKIWLTRNYGKTVHLEAIASYRYERTPKMKNARERLKNQIKEVLDTFYEEDPSLEFTLDMLGW